MDYLKINLSLSPFQPWSEILTADLANIGFDSFTEEDSQLQAFIPLDNFNDVAFTQLIDSYNQQQIEISFTKQEIPHENWNAVWESDFKPVEIGNALVIFAPFHDVNKNEYEYTIEIQPQMSFGTGHHQTTYLLSKAILKEELNGKTVLDVGTGTGILGILASKKGAKSVLGTEIDHGSFENALENIKRNNISNFEVKLGDIVIVPNVRYDVIIANINKNVLKRHLSQYSNLAKSGTLLFLSGFFDADVTELEKSAEEHNFEMIELMIHETWAVMRLLKH
jgi:ribosomal protein L11 methyltransferase